MATSDPAVTTLRSADLRLMLGASAGGLVGAAVGRTAIPLLAVTMLHATAFDVGMLTAAQTVAFLLIGLPAGAIVDRVRRRQTMIAMDVVRAGLTASVIVLMPAGLLNMGTLIAIAALLGCATVFFDVAAMAYLPHLVERDQLRGANGRLQAINSASSVGGPATAGAMVGMIGAAVTTAATGAGYAVSAMLLSRIRHREAPPEPRPWRGLAGSAWEGLRYVFRDDALRAIALCTASVNLALAVRSAVLVLFLVDLAFSPGEIGIAMAAAGLGGVLAAIGSATATMRRIWGVLLGTQAFAVLIPLAGGEHALIVVSIGLAASSYGAARYNIAQLTFRQLSCPPELLGRVGASNRFLVWSTLPIGGLLGGALGTYLSITTVLWLVAAGQVASVLWLTRFRREHGSEAGA